MDDPRRKHTKIIISRSLPLRVLKRTEGIRPDRTTLNKHNNAQSNISPKEKKAKDKGLLVAFSFRRCFFEWFALKDGPVHGITLAVGGIHGHAIDRVDDACDLRRDRVAVVDGRQGAVRRGGSAVGGVAVGKLRNCSRGGGFSSRLLGLLGGCEALSDGEDAVDDDGVDAFPDLSLFEKLELILIVFLGWGRNPVLPARRRGRCSARRS